MEVLLENRMPIINRDTGDETDHEEEQCEGFYEEYPWAEEKKRCRFPKGHKGQHGGWYFHPKASW